MVEARSQTPSPDGTCTAMNDVFLRMDVFRLWYVSKTVCVIFHFVHKENEERKLIDANILNLFKKEKKTSNTQPPLISTWTTNSMHFKNRKNAI